MKLIKRPQVISTYNTFKGGRDKSNQMISSYIESAGHISQGLEDVFPAHGRCDCCQQLYILPSFLQTQLMNHPHVQRSASDAQLQVREELVNQLANIVKAEYVPTYSNDVGRPCPPGEVCWHTSERTPHWQCSNAMHFRDYFCMQPEKKSLVQWHSAHSRDEWQVTEKMDLVEFLYNMYFNQVVYYLVINHILFNIILSVLLQEKTSLKVAVRLPRVRRRDLRERVLTQLRLFACIASQGSSLFVEVGCLHDFLLSVSTDCIDYGVLLKPNIRTLIRPFQVS